MDEARSLKTFWTSASSSPLGRQSGTKIGKRWIFFRRRALSARLTHPLGSAGHWGRRGEATRPGRRHDSCTNINLYETDKIPTGTDNTHTN